MAICVFTMGAEDPRRIQRPSGIRDSCPGALPLPYEDPYEQRSSDHRTDDPDGQTVCTGHLGYGVGQQYECGTECCGSRYEIPVVGTDEYPCHMRSHESYETDRTGVAHHTGSKEGYEDQRDEPYAAGTLPQGQRPPVPRIHHVELSCHRVEEDDYDRGWELQETLPMSPTLHM